MRYAVGFYGFARKIPNAYEVAAFFELFPKNSDVEIFLSVPNIIDEYLNIETPVDQKSLIEVFGGKVKISNFFDYDAKKHIKKSRDMGLADYNEKHRYHSYRQLSLIYSISSISKIIKDHSVEYDNIILTRLDLINTIKFGNLLKEPNVSSIYGWREFDPTTFEDRVIITCFRGIEVLSDMYDNFNSSLIDEKEGLVSEFYIGNYLRLFPELRKEVQINTKIGVPEWSFGERGKYSQNFKNYIDTILQF